MHPNSTPRRNHGAEIKAKVLAACRQPGASVAGVALAHGLNANLVRKWLHGRGLKRSGLDAPNAAGEVAEPPTVPGNLHPGGGAQFVPIVLGAAAGAKPAAEVSAPAATQPEASIHIELRRGPSTLSVRWPASAGADCAVWLRELAAGWLK